MKNTQKGFLSITIMTVIALLFAGAGSYYVVTKNKVDQETKLETAFPIEKKTAVNEGSTSKTEKSITVGASVKTNAEVVKPSFIVVDENELNKKVAEKYAGNSAYVNKLIKVRLIAAFSSLGVESFTIRAKDSSYSNICGSAKSFIEADIKKSLGNDQGTMSALNITFESYRTDEIICKADVDKFIITMPLTLEDGTQAKICSSSDSQFGLIGDANYQTFTCIKK